LKQSKGNGIHQNYLKEIVIPNWTQIQMCRRAATTRAPKRKEILKGYPRYDFTVPNVFPLLRRNGAQGVRTKYDRMFERKNQNVLSQHYNKLIDHEPEDSEDDFITLKRADHDLGGDIPDISNELSNRKLKMGTAKRKILAGGLAKKLIFDDEGEAHQLYEVEDGERWLQERRGPEGVKEEGQKYAEGEREKMKVTNVIDKQEARSKKLEKKPKRKEKEQAVSSIQSNHSRAC